MFSRKAEEEIELTPLSTEFTIPKHSNINKSA